MRITVWHNTGEGHYDGYRPEHPMLRVFSYTAPDGDPDSELWRAVELFNADVEMLCGDDAKIAAAYRARHLRSFSTGDGLSVRADRGPERFWVSTGYELLLQDGPYAQLAVDGPRPLGQRVTYIVPVLDDRIREGLFEVHAPHRTAEDAIAAHHGTDPRDVVILTGPS